MNKFDLIVVDMDGVLVNFRKGVFDLFGIENTKENLKVWEIGKEILNMKEKNFWNFIKNEKEFWLNLEPFPWKNKLMKIVDGYADNVVICSKSPMDAGCYSQKRKWLDKYNLGKYEHFIGNGNKSWMAGKNRVLIDDLIDNLFDFKDKEGYGILFPQEYNLQISGLNGIPKSRVGYVERMLKKIRWIDESM